MIPGLFRIGNLSWLSFDALWDSINLSISPKLWSLTLFLIFSFYIFNSYLICSFPPLSSLILMTWFSLRLFSVLIAVSRSF
jgi:hypothetical protein